MVESIDEIEEGIFGFFEVVVLLFYVLDSVEKYIVYIMLVRDFLVLFLKLNVFIVIGGSRGNVKNDGEEVEFVKIGFLMLVDFFKLRSFFLGDFGCCSLGFFIEDVYGDGWLVCEFDDGL